MPRWVCPAPRTRRSCRASCLRGTELRGPGGVRGCVRRAGRRGTVQIELVETEVGRVVLRRQVEGAGDLLHAGGHPCGGEFGGRRHARRRGARQQRRERREQRRRRGQQHGIGISAIPVCRRISSAISRAKSARWSWCAWRSASSTVSARYTRGATSTRALSSGG